jgi:hypothetical protein
MNVLFCAILYTFSQIFKSMTTDKRNFLKDATGAALLAVMVPNQ